MAVERGGCLCVGRTSVDTNYDEPIGDITINISLSFFAKSSIIKGVERR